MHYILRHGRKGKLIITECERMPFLEPRWCYSTREEALRGAAKLNRDIARTAMRQAKQYEAELNQLEEDNG